MRALALLAFAALSAHAQPGFFRDPGDRDVVRNQVKDTSYQCAMTIRYNVANPSGTELSGLTLPCVKQLVTAFNAARSKVFVYGEPALDPQYQCSIFVLWNDPAVPTVTYSGDVTCAAGRAQAITSAEYLWTLP